MHRLVTKIEHVTGIARGHFEPLQIVRYERGQYYRRHLDALPREQLGREQSIVNMGESGKLRVDQRLLTAFLYLNDVIAGGETAFTDLGLVITPKPGRLIVWPNVQDHDVNLPNPLSHHEAKVVRDGVKLGANIWAHAHPLRDWLQPDEPGRFWSS